MPGGLTQPPMPRRPPPPRPLSSEARGKLKSTAPPPPPPPPLPPRRRPPPLPAPLGPEALAEIADELEAPTRPRGRHVRGGAPLPAAGELAELAGPARGHRRGGAPLPGAAELRELAPPAASDANLVNPEIFSVLERYKQADRGVVKKGLGRMFSTRPGAAAVAPQTAATPQQLQAAGVTIGLVSQIADVTAKLAALDANADGATTSQQEAAANRARAAVWEKSGVPVDLRPLRSGVLGAEISANRAAFQAERVQASAEAQAKADKASRALVTKERAEKASLREGDAGEAVAETPWYASITGAIRAPTLEEAILLGGGAVQGSYTVFARTREAGDPLVKSLGDASSALGGALSIVTAVMQLKVAAMHTMAGVELSEIAGGQRDEDSARDIAMGGMVEVAAFKASIAAGKSVGSTISAMGGFLFATPAGPVLKIVGGAIGAAVTVADVTKDSYQAGKVAEKEFESLYHGDAEESAEYVLRYGAEHRAENLLRKARGQDEGALKALAVFGISAEDLAAKPATELRAQIIKHQGVATKNIGTRVSEGVSGIGQYFSDTGGAMIQHYRADIAERTARAKDLMLYGEGAKGQRHNLTKVRAAAFFRTGPQVDNERKAQLEILKIKKQKRNHGLDPTSLELVEALLLPQSHYQALKADHARKVKNIQLFGPGTSIQHPGPAGPPA